MTNRMDPVWNDAPEVFDRETVALLLEIEEFKGAWKACRLPPQRLGELRRIASIESVASSCRIEGAKLTDADVARIFSARSSQSHAVPDEREAAGCALLMREILESWEEMPLSDGTIRHMHDVLMLFREKNAGRRGIYKTADNCIAAFDPAGRQIGIVLETASTSDTPRLMTELLDWTNRQLNDKSLPALMVIGMFAAAFLAIHPFDDGNGRMARALTTLLLLRVGYAFVPYGSLDRIFEQSKESYYITLHATQKTLASAKPNWNIWLYFFLLSLAKLVRSLKRKIENLQLVQKMPEASSRILELVRNRGSVSIAEAAAVLNINKFALRDHFKQLVHDGRLMRVGNARASRYILR